MDIAKIFQKLIILSTISMALGVCLNATDRGPSTTEERARVIQLTKASENDLMNGISNKDREWFLKFIQEVPDLYFDAGPVGAWCVKSMKMKQVPSTLFQFMLSAVAFQIENPTKVKDSEAIDQAALEGVLRAYQNLIKKIPDARSSAIDSAITLRDKGNLKEFVIQLRAKK